MMKRSLLSGSIFALALDRQCFGLSVTCSAQSGDLDEDWAIVQDLGGGIHGIGTSPPAKLISSKYTAGALMGNGDVGMVAGDASVARQSFYFGKSDFWGAGAHYEGLPGNGTVCHDASVCSWTCYVSILSLGEMTISSHATSDGAGKVYRVDQDILRVRVNTTLNKAPITG